MPASAIVTEPFAATARMTAATWGMPDYPYVTISHPISDNGGDQLRDKAHDALTQAMRYLVARDEPAVNTPFEVEPSRTSGLAEDVEVPNMEAAIETFFARGWTDGLPVVPPTRERVKIFLDAVGLGPGDIIAEEPVRRRRLTADKVAINTVMAGCVPEHMTVIIAALRAMCAPEFNLHGSSASTGGSAIFAVVNGPIRRELGMNATQNVFANGNRANATIGRALRLIIVNMLGGVPGEFDRSTLGHPGKFTFCIAEDEEGTPWRALAQERGVTEGRSAVTVMACESPHQIMNEWTQDPKEILDTFVAAIRGNMLTYSLWAGNYALVIPKQLRDILIKAGWAKQDVRQYVYDHAVVFRREWRAAGKSVVVSSENEDKEYRALRSPDDLLVIAAGGPAGGFGAIIPPWLGNKALAVTQPVEW